MFVPAYKNSDIALREVVLMSNVDEEVIQTVEGQMMLEMIRMSIKDYQLYVRGNKRPLEAGEYHGKVDSGRYIRNVKWWLFDESEEGEYHSPLPFNIVCEFLGFNPGVVRKSIQEMAKERFVSSQQVRRKTNGIKSQETKSQDVATRARDDLTSEEGGKNDACRTVTGKT